MKKNILSIIFSGVIFITNVHAQCNPYQVPFYEDFQGITVNNQLPACWSASGMSTTCVTFGTGNKKNAAFYYLPAAQNYFFSPAIELKAGVVYSVSTWYKADNASNFGWSNLSIMLGTAQSSTGLTNVATVTSPWAIGYTLLSSTVSVSNTGSYYFAVACTSNGSGTSQYLHFDDLSIIIPCSLNKPIVSVTATPPSTVCEGDIITFVASGADTFTWCAGATGDTLQVIASQTATWLCNNNLVTGEDTLSGCMQGASPQFTIYPTPNVNAFANPSTVCKGQVSNLLAFGATDYYWTFGPLTAGATVTPIATTMYTVIGSNIYGCSSTAIVQVVVNPLPPVDIIDFPDFSCANWYIEYTSTSLANTYTWNVGSQMYSGNPLQFTTPVLNGTINITLSVSDNNGCVGTSSSVLEVQICSGLNEITGGTSFIYPNPNNGVIIVETGVEISAVRLFNMMGQEQSFEKPLLEMEKLAFDLSHLPDGVYLLMVGKEAHRLVKNTP